MKIILILVVGFTSSFFLINNKPEKNYNEIEFLIFNDFAGGSSNVNTLNKTSDSGSWDVYNGDEIIFSVDHNYKVISKVENAVVIGVDLKLIKKDNKDLKWSKEITIRDEEILEFQPFDDITMKAKSTKR